MAEVYLPAGWPEAVAPPGAEDWERSAVDFPVNVAGCRGRACLGVLAALNGSIKMAHINFFMAPAATPPVYPAWKVASFWATEVSVLLPGVLWLWMARAVYAGRGWARVLSGAAWCLGFGLIPVLGGWGIPLSWLFWAVGVPEALGLAALVLLFAPASSRYFRLARPAPGRRAVQLPPRPAGVRWCMAPMFLGAGVTLVLGGIVAARSYVPFALVPGGLWLWLAFGTARGRGLAWGAQPPVKPLDNTVRQVNQVVNSQAVWPVGLMARMFAIAL